MDLSPALNTFIAESRELLEDMESSLLALEERPDDVDLVNAVFRAAHTIKGSAGLFALEPIVGFTHAVESLLDRVRSGALGLDGELVALLLLCRDHMAKLIAAVDQGGDGAWPQQPEPLLAQVRGYLQGDGAQRQQKAGAPAPTEAADQEAAGTAASACWHVSLRFGPDVLRNGMDPASFIRYLKNLGEIVHVDTLLDALPEAEAMDPEACYLGFEIALRSEADKAAIDAVFDFVREDCLIRILPPHARLEDYARLIQELSEENQPLGEMLVASGALTRSELDAALALQHSLPAGAAPRREQRNIRPSSWARFWWRSAWCSSRWWSWRWRNKVGSGNPGRRPASGCGSRRPSSTSSSIWWANSSSPVPAPTCWPSAAGCPTWWSRPRPWWN